MFIKENVLLAIAGLRANKMRALLTMLGIIIGIASVIAIVTVGNALTASFKDTMAGMGANNITVYVKERGSRDFGVSQGPSSLSPSDSDLITAEQIEEFRIKFADRISELEISETYGNATAKDGRLYANTTINGVNSGYRKTQNIKMIKGRFLTDNDVKGIKKIAVISDKFAEKMFGKTSPLGKEIKLFSGDRMDTYFVAGVYKYEPFALSMNIASDKDLRTNVYVPVTVVKAAAKDKNYMYFTVMTKDNVDTPQLIKDIKVYLSKLYSRNAYWEATAATMEGMVASLTSMLGKISIAVSVIAAISLMVGGIGVMNIMLVAVTERTREIGTRKALGARSSFIKLQFIVEAMIICGIGGFIGVVLGILMGMLGATLLKAPIVISIPIILISVTFSMLIGVFFGYYPANKAANLDPIEALRYE